MQLYDFISKNMMTKLFYNTCVYLLDIKISIVYLFIHLFIAKIYLCITYIYIYVMYQWDMFNIITLDLALIIINIIIIITLNVCCIYTIRICVVFDSV